MNNFKGIIYLSKATIDFNEKSLKYLAANAAKTNKRLGVTGYLYFVRGKFLQYIEGEKSIVQETFDRIEQDSRHKIINILQDQDLPAQKFPSWNMQYLTKDMLIQINMEGLVIERMEYLKKINDISNKNAPPPEKEKAIWRMVDTISRLSKI